MTDYTGEQWKAIEFDFEYSNETRFEVSNYGRVRSFHWRAPNGNILKPGLTLGYEFISLKFLKPRDKSAQEQLDALQEEVVKLTSQLALMKKSGESETAINDTKNRLTNLNQHLKKKRAEDIKLRRINWQSLVHRIVATYFLEKPSQEHTLVAHLDYQKRNNSYRNLKWMTPAENYAHQQKSPNVIKDKLEKKYGNKTKSKATKLTVTRVMLLKKMLNQGKPMKQLVRLFKVTETQIFRIKRGENWKDIEAAK
jgi:hypothetical protein